MRQSLSAALTHVSSFEGGYVNHPADPGGCTNRGITIATYRKHLNPKGTCADLRRLTWAQAADIYRDSYWAAVSADELPAGLDLLVFDMAVNAGPGRAARLLQRLVGVTEDGQIGPVTLRAVQARTARELVNGYTEARLTYYRSRRNFATFGRGWSARAEAARKTALRLVGDAEATQKKSPQHPDSGALGLLMPAAEARGTGEPMRGIEIPLGETGVLSALVGARPWWQSRTLIGASVVVAAQAVRLLAPEAQIDVGATTDAVLSLLSLLGGGLAWWGRVRAQAPIRFRRAPGALPPAGGADPVAAERMHGYPVEPVPSASARDGDGHFTDEREPLDPS